MPSHIHYEEDAMRLNPDSLTVESYSTADVPDKVGHASSMTGYACSSACIAPTCQYQAC